MNDRYCAEIQKKIKSWRCQPTRSNASQRDVRHCWETAERSSHWKEIPKESRLVVRKTLAFVFTCIRGELLRSWEKRQWGCQCSAPTNSAKCSSYIHHYPRQIRHRPRKQSWSLCRQASHRFHADRNLPGHTSVPCWLHRAAVHLIKTKTSPP